LPISHEVGEGKKRAQSENNIKEKGEDRSNDDSSSEKKFFLK
jgi:hypothetical protein